jgi:hypothetical protein
MSHTSQFLYWSIVAYILALSITKFSILLQYRRIFASSKRMRVAIYVVGAFILAWCIEAIFASAFMCRPISAFWDLTIVATSKCINGYALYYTNAAINILTDLAVAMLPLPSVWGLQLPRKQKIALMFILAIGWL